METAIRDIRSWYISKGGTLTAAEEAWLRGAVWAIAQIGGRDEAEISAEVTRHLPGPRPLATGGAVGVTIDDLVDPAYKASTGPDPVAEATRRHLPPLPDGVESTVHVTEPYAVRMARLAAAAVESGIDFPGRDLVARPVTGKITPATGESYATGAGPILSMPVTRVAAEEREVDEADPVTGPLPGSYAEQFAEGVKDGLFDDISDPVVVEQAAADVAAGIQPHHQD